tara:strand:+ start:4066 stop:4602 length:537 start_codon:yes stop_codon:yes gene_type:complete
MKKTGFGILIVSTLLLLGGTIGFTMDGAVEDVPTPNVQGLVFFSDDAMTGNAAALLLNADTTITWDRDDVFLVIADKGKKKQCDDIANGGSLSGFDTTSQTCSYGDEGYVASGDDGIQGVDWRVESGEFYPGIGTKEGVLPEGSDLNLSYTIDLTLSAAGYLFLLIGEGAGFLLVRQK